MSKSFVHSIRALVVAIVFSQSIGHAGDFLIHDGDRVVFLGDSITEQRLYTTYIEGYTLSRHPDWKLNFRNVGWGGDTSWLRQRVHPDEAKLFAANPEAQQKMVEDSVKRGLDRDVLPLRPTFVTVKFGMNDHSYQVFRPDIFSAYTRSQTEIAKILTSERARVAFLTPQPIEDRRPDPDADVRNQSLRKFSDGLKEVAEKTHTTFVDQFDPYMKIMLAERSKDSKAFIGAGDAVHPGPKGHTIMAWAVLKGLGATPLVSRADINATGNGSSKTENCKISDLNAGNGRVSFERLDNALPMPIDKRATEALAIAPILDDLSRYELRVGGLPKGSYNISIDGEPVTSATDAELDKGVNLASNAGSITKQCGELLDLVFKKNDAYFNRWRSVQLFTPPGWAQGPEFEAKRAVELKRLDAEIADYESKIDAARKPKSHRFEIAPKP